jgi:hypothetical protein
MSFQKPTDPYQQLAEQIRLLQAEVRDLRRPRPFLIPVLSADPPTSDPTNMWLFPDGRLRARHLNPAGSAFVTREWVPTAAGAATTGTAIAPPTSAPTTRQTEWSATYTQSYRQSGAARTDAGVVQAYYGSSGDAFNGRNRSLVGFDYAAIAAELAGSTILDVWVRMVNVHSYNNSGSYVHLGIHNFSAEPATWAGGGIPRSMLSKQHWNKGATFTAHVPLEFAQSIRDGWGKGLALESPSDSRDFYGYMGGVGSGYPPPVLIVQYAK